MNEPTDINSSNRDYTLQDGSTDCEKFVEDLLSQDVSSQDSDKVANILRNNLTSVTVATGAEQPSLERISPSNTSEKTVSLMQKKLHELSPDTEVDKIEIKSNERALTIATFRLLNRLPSLMQKSSLGVDYDELILDLKMKLDGLVATTDKERYWRTPVYDEAGVLLAKSHEVFDRKNGYNSNPEGKVSLEEMNTHVLPRVIKIVTNI